MKHKLLLFLILPMSAFADELILTNVQNGCSSDLNQHTYFGPTFTQNQYQCNSGYYVPANNDGCVACPEYYDCNGGTFTFNENLDQGSTFKTIITNNITNGCRIDFIRSLNNVASMAPIFIPNVHNCSPGYYMPANTDGCVICPADSYCPGGTYTFNETLTQGITACANGLYAPTGMWESAQCGRILHIGDEVLYLRTTKKTMHALHIDVDQDGIADYFGNMTTADVPMHAGTTRKLKVQFNGQIYSIYDDTVNVGE